MDEKVKKFFNELRDNDDTMNIYSKNGEKVKFTGYTRTNRAGEIDENAVAFLENDGIYTVEKTVPCPSVTFVYLQEFPDKRFNSVDFSNVKE